MIFTQTQAFVYKWTHQPSLRWYIGSRTAQGCHPEDGYICSSRQVKPLIESAESDWIRTIIAQGSAQDMLALETVILETADAKHDVRSYNQHNGDGRFTTTGTVAWNKGIKKPRGTPSWNSGKPNPHHSEVMKGKPAHNKGKSMSEEQKLKLSLARKGQPSPKKGLPGKPQTEEANAKRSAKLKGRKQSAEWVEKRVAGKRGKPNPGASRALTGISKPKLVSRLLDRKEMCISNFVQWCNLKDKQARGEPHPLKGRAKSAEHIAKRTASRLKK